jgi:hypothetical protein
MTQPTGSPAQPDTASPAVAVDPQLLKLLVCPLTRSPLRLEGDKLVGTVGGLRYPIRNGIPVLLVDEAELPQGIASLEEFKRRFACEIPL